MKKKLLLVLISFLSFSQIRAQSTETFETEGVGSSSFTDSGKVFNITSQAPAIFDVFLYSNGGWNGTTKDHKFIDNSGTTFFNTPVEFTISAAGSSAFTLKKFYLFLSKSDLGLSVSGTLTITGKLGGAEVFTNTVNSPFNTSMAVNNGFTLIDMVNFGGVNNSNTSIDQFVIKTTGNIAYVALDAMTWQCPSVTVTPVAQTNIACNGDATGSATVSAAGGNGFAYDWTPGNPAGDGTATATGLTAGTWTCTVTNSCGLSSATSFTITAPATGLTATQSQTDVTCNGGSNGTASVVASGGTGAYTYLWSPTGGTAATATGRTAGSYTVTITDANGCSIQKNFTINAPAALTAIQSQTDVTCTGGSNGTASVVASGGTGAYTYLWSPTGGTAATATGRTAGSYTVTITDANGCSIQKNFTINAPAALTATQSQTDVTCNGDSNGTASVVASGGTGAYTYLWSPSGGTAATATGRTAGSYTVTITDANGCSIQKNFTINAPAALTATQSQTDVTCNGDSNGTASVVASGGTGAYTYLWSPSGGTAATATGRTAGSYTVTITDANGCSIQKDFTINAPAVLTATQSQTDLTCNGGSNGTASVFASGGTGSYTYIWSPTGGTAATATGLSEGSYMVTITDANSCSIQKSFTINAPAVLTATQSQTDLTCNGGSNGTASVFASGGTGSYTYVWSPAGGTAATATGLSEGSYTVTITDANSCSIQKNFTITAPAALTATQSQTDLACTGSSNGTASVFASGGTGSYTYIWSPTGGTAATATGLSEGSYTVTISDANGCSIQKNFTIGNVADCSIATLWDGTSWSNGIPDCNSYAATINANYDSALNGAITACSLTVSSGDVTVASGDNFIIKGVVTVSGGSLTFEQNSNLIQSDEVANSGTIAYKRNSSALYGLDHTIWSSPVSGSQKLKEFSPLTLDQYFYVYNTSLNAYSNYLSASGVFGGNPDEEEFVTAKGYLIRMPEGSSQSSPSVFNGTFTGTPNNGTTSIALNTGNARFNAVGNPYPSPVNVQDFILFNQSNLDDGTLYFWRKRNGSTGTAYATVTLAAYVASNALGGDTSAGAFNVGEEANWVINPGQGFIVKAAPTAAALDFTNTMRRAVNNGQFFRAGMENNVPLETLPASKLWLDITNANNEFGQTAIAYTSLTTLGLDYGYDGKLINDGSTTLYSIAEDTKLIIQAREVFNAEDEVPLGYKTSADGSYTINISQKTGVFNEGQHVYLRDNLLGVLHDLSENGAYTFATSEGTFENRFTVVYDGTLDAPAFEGDYFSISKNRNIITVNSGKVKMKSITIYDMLGRIVYSKEGIAASLTKIDDLNAEEQVLIVQVITEEGTIINKKIIH